MVRCFATNWSPFFEIPLNHCTFLRIALLAKCRRIINFFDTTVLARLDVIEFQSSFDGRNTAEGILSVRPLEQLLSHTAGSRSQPDRAMPDRSASHSLVRVEFFVT
jgi:hypothetical protein